MIKLRDYYSDVVLQDDDFKQVKCCNCGEIFPTLEILLDVKNEEDEDPEEYCPFCDKKGCLMDLNLDLE